MKCSMTYRKTAGVLALLLLLLLPAENVLAEEKAGEEMLVLEKVYAFSSPVELLDKIDVLLEEQFPLVLGIMPVYINTNYPAMLEFTEVIRYAQSQGYRILLHFPIIQKESIETEEVIQVIEEQIYAWKQRGIDPRGILMGPDDQEYEWMTEELESILPVFTLGDTYLEYYQSTLKENFPIMRIENLPKEMYPYEAKEIPKDFDFERGIIKDISVSLEKQNKMLMVIVVIGVAAFTGMIVYARRRNRKDFFGKDEDK